MKIDAEQFWRDVEDILLTDGLSLNELAKISGLEYRGLLKKPASAGFRFFVHRL